MFPEIFPGFPAIVFRAYCDRETGLVWESAPGDADRNGNVDDNDLRIWSAALGHCYAKEVGGRNGWRLPTIEELASLVDTSQQADPALPAGHPFINVQSDFYWSATTLADFTNVAWAVAFFNGDVNNNNGFVSFNKSIPFNFAWCVRGGQGIDGVQ